MLSNSFYQQYGASFLLLSTPSTGGLLFTDNYVHVLFLFCLQVFLLFSVHFLPVFLSQRSQQLSFVSVLILACSFKRHVSPPCRFCITFSFFSQMETWLSPGAAASVEYPPVRGKCSIIKVSFEYFSLRSPRPTLYASPSSGTRNLASAVISLRKELYT